VGSSTGLEISDKNFFDRCSEDSRVTVFLLIGRSNPRFVPLSNSAGVPVFSDVSVCSIGKSVVSLRSYGALSILGNT
jgi:hypothetical protein